MSYPGLFWALFVVLWGVVLYLYFRGMLTFLGWFFKMWFRCMGFFMALLFASALLSTPVTLPLIGMGDSFGFDPDKTEAIAGYIVLLTMPLTLYLRHKWLKRKTPKN